MNTKLALAFFYGALLGIALMYVFSAAYDYVCLTYTPIEAVPPLPAFGL